MFLGTHSPRMDDKGRLFLPAKFRDQLASGVVLAKGQERCIYVFPHAEFVALTDQLRSASLANRPGRDYLRVLMSAASDEVPDRQGRITVPAQLRAYAGLTKDCVVLGVNTRLEIWDAMSWEQYLASKEEGFAELSEEVLPGVL